MKKRGVLYVVATPIGNLEDITLRALRILKEANYILCEDKRTTLKLLNKYKIKNNLISYHKFNEEKELPNIIQLLESGQNIALVSDAGSPLISDPGVQLISMVYKQGIRIVSIPGASALISTLSICPIKFNEFTFLGFLPDKTSKRIELISSLTKNASVAVIYIAPHDLKKYVKEICTQYPLINIFYARELTKFYEETWFGKIKDFISLIEEKKFKGEMVLVLDFRNVESNNERKSITNEDLLNFLNSQINAGLSVKSASKEASKFFKISSREIYNIYVKK